MVSSCLGPSNQGVGLFVLLFYFCFILFFFKWGSRGAQRGPELTTRRPRPELQSRVSHLTDQAPRAPPGTQ